MELKWQNLLTGEDSAKTVVFSGGACNAIDERGVSVRNTERDGLNQRLDTYGIAFFDPQIHADTHGRNYDYDLDGPGEKAARDAATVTLYQIGDNTLAAATSLEVMRDASSGKNVIIWLSGSRDEKGNAIFVPANLPDPITLEPVVRSHIAEYVSHGGKLRKELVAFLGEQANVTFVQNEQEAYDAIMTCIDQN